MPGPALPTMLGAAVVAAGADDPQRKALLPAMVDGTVPTAVVLPGAGTLDGPARRRRLARRRWCGGARARRHPGQAAPRPRGRRGWRRRGWPPSCGASSTSTAPGSAPLRSASLDPTRRVGTVRVEGLVVEPERQLPAVSSTTVRDLALVLAAAECAGGARWCLDVGTAYAIERRQFGRPIGQFQAIKHRLADMLVAVEQVTALAWDTAQAADAGDAAQAQLSAVLAGAFALDASSSAPRAASRSWGGWASPGSTTPTCTCAGRCRCASWWARARRLRVEAHARRPRRQPAPARAGSPRGSRAHPGAGPRRWWPRWPPRPTTTSDVGGWSTPGFSPRTGRCRGDGVRARSSSS